MQTSNLVVQISPQGQNRLSHILTQRLKSASAQLSQQNPAETLSRNLTQVFQSREFKTYLGGFNPHVHIGQLDFDVQLEQIRVLTSFEKLQSIAEGRSGVWAEVEISLNHLNIQAQKMGVDLVAPGVGHTGVNHLAVSTQKPITVRVPFFLSLEGDSSPRVEILNLEGIQLTNLDVQFQDFILPKIEILIDGHKVDLIPKDSVWEKAITALKQQSLSKELAPQVLKYLNTAINQVLQTKADTLNPSLNLSPVLSQISKALGNTLNSNDLRLDINLSQLNTRSDNSVLVGARVQPTSKIKTSQEPNRRCEISCWPHDMAVAVNRELMQDMINALWEKGFFSNIPVSNSQLVSLVEPPQLVSQSTVEGHNKAQKLALDLQIRPQQTRGMKLTGDNFNLKLRMEIMIEMTPDGDGVKFDVLGFKADKIAFRESDLAFPLRLAAAFTPDFLKPQFQNMLVDKINSVVTDGRLKQTVLIKDLGPLDEMVGPVRMKALSFDSYGNLFFLIDFEKN